MPLKMDLSFVKDKHTDGQKWPEMVVQYTLDLRKPDLRKNIDLRKIVATTDFFST